MGEGRQGWRGVLVVFGEAGEQRRQSRDRQKVMMDWQRVMKEEGVRVGFLRGEKQRQWEAGAVRYPWLVRRQSAAPVCAHRGLQLAEKVFVHGKGKRVCL